MPILWGNTYRHWIEVDRAIILFFINRIRQSLLSKCASVGSRVGFLLCKFDPVNADEIGFVFSSASTNTDFPPKLVSQLILISL